MAAAKLTLKQMCTRFDVTPRTLRHYESVELLNPERQGRARLYGSREIARVELILRGRRFGFSLENIRQWLLLYDEDHTNRLQMERWIVEADTQLAELESRQSELEIIINDLKALRDNTIDALGK